jgi:hypothetical protein
MDMGLMTVEEFSLLVTLLVDALTHLQSFSIGANSIDSKLFRLSE